MLGKIALVILSDRVDFVTSLKDFSSDDLIRRISGISVALNLL